MKSMIILNFTWAHQGLIATGQKPTRPEQIDWLIGQGIRAIVSLEDIPDSIALLIRSCGLDYLFFDLDEWSDSDHFDVSKVPEEKFVEFNDFVLGSLGLNRPIFVHCSGGIRRSPEMVKRFLKKYLQPKI